MNQCNLIPIERQQRALDAARRKLWIGIGSAVGSVSLAVSIACWALSGGQSLGAPDLVATRQATAQCNRKTAGIRAETAKAQRVLYSARQVSSQPDWSVLLALAWTSLSDEVVLTRLDLIDHRLGARDETSPTAKPSATLPRVAPIDCQISGLAKSQSLVAAYVLRLQALHIFEDVRMLRSTPQAVGSVSAIGFDIDSTIGTEPTEGK